MFRPFFLLALAAASSLVVTAQTYGKGFTGKKVLSAYFPSYQMSPADVPYAKYTHLDYFVFTTTPSASAISQAGIDDSLIRDFVSRAHKAGVTVSYTVGGWTGSQHFSTHVATATSRNTFARTLVAVMQQYGFDGIDIDWEYPGSQGQGDNVVSPSDAANLLLFLQTLRSVAGIDTRLSMDVPPEGIIGANGAPLADLSGYAAVLDYLTVMTYDMTGTWSGFTGPNSPWSAGCAPPSNPFSISSAISKMQGAGFKGNHILIGLPNYAYAYWVKRPYTQRTCPDGTTTIDYQFATSGSTCGSYIGTNGQYLYRELVAKNYFKPSSGFRKIQEAKYAHAWTLYNPTTSEFISTDAPGTIWFKARQAFQYRLAGVNFFDASGDTSDGRMAQAARYGLLIDPIGSLTYSTYTL
ncbi:endochitinase [Rhodotorula diobovata]|uniref:Endochitinase n=1 Tax=Rhodotorula diobovata TaxID=5288 RepID=A0A5C5FLC1_9BASI|nr:endochitinase [Rhodotorula diobovata]